MRHGIRVGHSRPYHPQTQGKLERFHRSLKAEVLQKWFADSGELQRAFDHWRTVYNLERPHEALEMAVPASRYQPSSRQYSVRVAGIRRGRDGQEGGYQREAERKGLSLKAGKAFRESVSG